MAAPKYLKLGKNLKRLLFERNMKPVDLAREVNLPQPTVHRLVSGKSTRPDKSSLEPIAEFFSVSVEELLGESPTEHKSKKDNKQNLIANSAAIKNIPVIDWAQLTNLQKARDESKKHIVTIGHLTDQSFAAVMPDSSMEPSFAQGTLLILDPNKQAKDRSYVLVKLSENNLYVFRQLLINGNDKYLKPLNPDLSLFKMRLLEESDEVVALLVESRNQYLPEDQQILLGELSS